MCKFVCFYQSNESNFDTKFCVSVQKNMIHIKNFNNNNVCKTSICDS